MTVDKVGGAGNIQPTNNIKPIDKTLSAGVDRIEISNEAKIALQKERLFSIVKSAPDIREDKVLEARKRLDSYMKDGVIKDEILNALADSFTDSIFNDEK